MQVQSQMLDVTDRMIRDVVEKKKMSWVCAHCVKLWRSLAKGQKKCEAALQNKGCGGPIVGLAYPEYEGVLTRESMVNYCFVCGAESDGMAMPKNGSGDGVGFCRKHEDRMFSMKVVETREAKES